MIGLDYIYEAVELIEKRLIGKDEQETLFEKDVLDILVAQNLLNAAIKQKIGSTVLTYSLIKGSVALLLKRIIIQKRLKSKVKICIDTEEDIVYFRIAGLQLSFHHVPMNSTMESFLNSSYNKKQVWDKIKWQKQATELFDRIVKNESVTFTDNYLESIAKLNNYLLSKSDNDSIAEYANETKAKINCLFYDFAVASVKTLEIALLFDSNKCSQFTLMRRRDYRIKLVKRYEGNNFEQVITYLTRGKHLNKDDIGTQMEKEKLYQFTTKRRIRTLSPCRAILAKTIFHYIIHEQKAYNLCITYNMARYIANMVPTARFVNILNFNRLKVRNRYYNLTALKNVPIGSKSRSTKVWCIVQGLEGKEKIEIDKIPEWIMEEYINTPDYYEEYEITHIDKKHCTLYGLKSFMRNRLLPCVYRQIKIHGNFAHVQNMDGFFAIYSLLNERFETDFNYHSIIYDVNTKEIKGIKRDYSSEVIYKFRSVLDVCLQQNA